MLPNTNSPSGMPSTTGATPSQNVMKATGRGVPNRNRSAYRNPSMHAQKPAPALNDSAAPSPDSQMTTGRTDIQQY
jgi:hypothetical protein